MTDRYFADCCYGTDQQHASWEPCPQERRVYVCSNPRCVAVYDADPCGHCPTCIQSSGVGFSTINCKVLSLSATPAQSGTVAPDKDGLGRFGHHPDPAIDFEIEVESLQSIIIDKELGLRTDEPLPVERMERAMEFRVGGVETAVVAKELLRQLEERLLVMVNLASHTPDEGALTPWSKAGEEWPPSDEGAPI